MSKMNRKFSQLLAIVSVSVLGLSMAFGAAATDGDSTTSPEVSPIAEDASKEEDAEEIVDDEIAGDDLDESTDDEEVVDDSDDEDVVDDNEDVVDDDEDVVDNTDETPAPPVVRTGDSMTAIAPLMAGFAVVASAAFVLRRRASK